MAKKTFMLGNRDNLNRNQIQNNLTQIINTNTYTPKVDYQMLQVDETEKIKLIELEQIVVKKQEIISSSLMDISMALYDAQKILSREKVGDGTFIKWIEQLGLSRPFVYRCLDKYKLYLISNMETVMDLTARETTMITKALNNKEIEEAEVIDIINSDNIAKAIEYKIKGPEEPEEVDIDYFKELSLDDKKEKLKQTTKDRKNLELLLKEKREELEILKEEIKLQKEKIAVIKELEKSMKAELENNV